MTDQQQITKAISRLLGVRRFRSFKGSDWPEIAYLEIDLHTRLATIIYKDGKREGPTMTYGLAECLRYVKEGWWIELDHEAKELEPEPAP